MPGRAFAACLLLLAAATAWGLDYQVDAARGDDATGDGSTLRPWRTLTHAFSRPLAAGDRVWVGPGDYDQAGGEVFPLVLPRGVWLQGPGDGSARVHGGITVCTAGVAGLTHLGSGTGSGAGISILCRWPNPISPIGLVRGCVVDGFDRGIEVAAAVDTDFDPVVTFAASIQGNVVRNNRVGIDSRFLPTETDSPAELRLDLTDNVVVGNEVGVRSYTDCFICSLVTAYQRLRLRHNTIAASSGNGMEPISELSGRGFSVLDAVNNVFAFNGGWGLEVVIPGTIQVLTDNLFWQNALGHVSSVPDPTPQNRIADPLFVDWPGGDFHLAAGSPAVDTANDAERTASDYELDARPLDGDGDGSARADVGADERRVARPAALRSAVFTAVDPPAPDRSQAFPFGAANPLTPVARADFVSGDLDPRPGILADPARPMAFYQVDPPGSEALHAVKERGLLSLRFFLR